MDFLLSVDEKDLNLFKKPSQARHVVKTKKEKKAEKQAKLRSKKGLEGPKIIGNDENDDDGAEQLRQPFTKGWEEKIAAVPSLPIKHSGKVVSVLKRKFADTAKSDDESDTEETGPTQGKGGNEIVAQDSSDFDFADDLTSCNSDGIIEKRAKSTNLTKSKSKSSKNIDMVNRESISVARKRIADICKTVMTDPFASLTRRKHDNDEDANSPRLVDLFDYFNHKDGKVVEIAMLSAVLIFKDILPGYRIRPNEELDLSVQLKKETKRIRDFEQSLLGAYQRYLKFVEEKISLGLGSPKRIMTNWSDDALLGLSALRCMCELLLAVPHFNFRSILLTCIISRAAQESAEIHSVCCRTLTQVFHKDVDGESSFEIVKTIAKVLVAMKYDVPEDLIRILESVKVRVHADEAKDLRKKAKQERRKRKRRGDDVDAGLLAADALNKTSAKRFQADVLQEICLIYFRIVKMKVGFKLLPCALEGLGRITHLINMDTVEDLLALMRTLLEATAPAAPALIRLHCIYCALRTLSGPGQELGLDDEIFVGSLQQLMGELPSDFERWDIVLQCVELCLVQRRESRKDRITSILKLLLLVASHMDAMAGATALTLAHCVLLKYPSIRMNLFLQFNGSPKEEEEVADMAMQALTEDGNTGAGVKLVRSDGDGYWALPLLRMHAEPRYRYVVGTLTGKDIVPLPFRPGDACPTLSGIIDRAEAACRALPTPAKHFTGAGAYKKTLPVKGKAGKQVLTSTPSRKSSAWLGISGCTEIEVNKLKLKEAALKALSELYRAIGK